ncbi:hypothetical protein BDFB_009806 [Asbolus verrucosus]|uniref:Uncharacterized protein n=1 Tax=Asbolus verrucosus TaxID=1661398 RepID=A0A482VAL7_ASBVE|nr:hypothetical protein BDFB_009806 [Asbolus verrucosus]
MSLCLFGVFNTILSGSSSVIPTKEEQANLLTNVQEVFEQVKVLVNVEANSTDESVVDDINRMVQRAKDKLSLLEELNLTKMSRGSNSVCMLEYKQIVQKLTHEGTEELKFCIKKGWDDITSNSFYLTNATIYATDRGQNFLDTLYNCSCKPGLKVISCYKEVIAKDVVPVKNMLLAVIETHKLGHFRTIEIRNVANDCIDDIIERYRIKMARVLNEAVHCT